MKRSNLRDLVMLAALLGLAASAPAFAVEEASRMSREDVKARMDNPDMVIIDVRSGNAWKDSDLKIKGAVREDPEAVNSWVDQYPQEKTLIFYCS